MNDMLQICVCVLAMFTCSLSLTTKETELSSRRALNGVVATIEGYPFYVSLLAKGYPICGGSVISNDFVLTAAHCLDRILRNEELTVKVGSDNDDDGRNCSIASIIRHPRYVYQDVLFDYALLKLAIRLHFDNKVSAIELGTVGDIQYGAIGTLVGRDISHLGFSVLLKGNLIITDVEYCEQGKREENNPLPEAAVPYYRETTICTKSNGVPPQSGCPGDSGGPFVVKGRLAGVASEGFYPGGGDCGSLLEPVLNAYASVPAVESWIRRVANIK